MVIVAGCSMSVYGAEEQAVSYQEVPFHQIKEKQEKIISQKMIKQGLYDAAMDRYTAVDGGVLAKETATYIQNLQDNDGNKLINLKTPETYIVSILELGKRLNNASISDSAKIYILEYLIDTSELSNGETQYTAVEGYQDETNVIDAANGILNKYRSTKRIE
jgi:hypothetical protein